MACPSAVAGAGSPGWACRAAGPRPRDRRAAWLDVTPAGAGNVRAVAAALRAQSRCVRHRNALPDADRAAVDRLVGDLRTRMERGEFHLVAVGRALITDPDWARKVRAGCHAGLLPFETAALAGFAWRTIGWSRDRLGADSLTMHA